MAQEMAELVTVTEVARHFSDVINRVQYQDRAYLLTRGGQVVAHLSAPAPAPISFDEFLRLWQERPRLDRDDAERWETELAKAKAQLTAPAESLWDS